VGGPGDATSSSGSVDNPPGPLPQILTAIESVTAAGVPREYALATPSTYSAEEAYPLVLVLHGDGGDGPSMRAAFPFDEASGQRAIVAYPSGNHKGWDLYDPTDQNADMLFLLALIDAVEQRFRIDPAMVFATGFSSGAFMVNQLACRRPGLLRGIAPHSGGAPDEPSDPAALRWENGYTRCAGQAIGSGPAALVIHGSDDTTVSYASGDFSASYWAYVNGCASSRAADALPECVHHDSCPSGKGVLLCSVPNLGHSLWGGASSAMWTFFRSL
jgi:polyhydroxybutyrate depolymerase